MKMIYYNALSICFLILAGFLAYFDKDGYGWCIFGAIVCGVTVSTTTKKDE
jgi:hypothetical protein